MPGLLLKDMQVGVAYLLRDSDDTDLLLELSLLVAMLQKLLVEVVL